MSKVKLHFTKGTCELENGLVEFVGGINGVSSPQVQFHILCIIRKQFNVDYWIEPKLEECFTLPSELNHLRYGLCKYIYLKFTEYPKDKHKTFVKLTRDQIVSDSGYSVRNIKLVDKLPDRPRPRDNSKSNLEPGAWDGEEDVDPSIFETNSNNSEPIDETTKDINSLRSIEPVRLEYYNRICDNGNDVDTHNKILERIGLLDLKEYQLVENLKMKVLSDTRVKEIRCTFSLVAKQCENSLAVLKENKDNICTNIYKERISKYENLVEFCDLFL